RLLNQREVFDNGAVVRDSVGLALVPAGGAQELLRLLQILGRVLGHILRIGAVRLEAHRHETDRSQASPLVAAAGLLLAVGGPPDRLADPTLPPGPGPVRPPLTE